MLNRNVELYVDDIVVKFDSCIEHIKDLKEVFKALPEHDIRINTYKSAFGVEGGKFLVFILTYRCIEANPGKFRAITKMRNLENTKKFRS